MKTRSMTAAAAGEKDDDNDSVDYSIPRRQHTRLWTELDSFQDLFHVMRQVVDEMKENDEDSDTGPAVGDVAGELIRDADFFSWDFSGDRRVYMLFFMGSSDHFPAIWIGDYADREDSEALVEQMPIHYFMTDMDEPDLPNLPSHKNLREYLQDLVDWSRTKPTLVGAELDWLQSFVNTLSETSVERGAFLPRLAEDVAAGKYDK